MTSFFILTFYATTFSNIIIDLCHIHCFINNVITNSKMLCLTSHKLKKKIFPDRWAGKCYYFEYQFLRLYAVQKTLMWVGFKRHKFNNSHFILVTKVTIHNNQKKDPGFNPIFANLDTYNSC